MPLPSRPESEISVQSVIFDRDAVVITYAETADVHLDRGQPLILTHTLTVSSDISIDVQQLHEDLVDWLVSVHRLFDDSPAVLDTQGDEESSSDDDYRGMGE